MMNKKKLTHGHHSAVQHVTGESVYVNDMDFGNNLLHGLVVYSPHAHAGIKSIKLDEAKKLQGVAAILTAKDIPGVNQMGPVVHDEPCLAEKTVEFAGQAIVLIAANSDDIAREAAKLVEIEYEPFDAILNIDAAIKAGNALSPVRKIETGNVDEIFEDAPKIISGTLETGAQEHWYLETQSCICIPQEAGEMAVHSSTQHPSETQNIIAEVLGTSAHKITVETRRMGGAFGGKETQANHVAAWCALLANATKRPVKIHLFRDDDQIMTGKRHRFKSHYKAAFDDKGKILALDVQLNSDGGASLDLSVAILERALFHIDNAYYIPNLRVTGQVWKTNLPPNTAFRGFGGPQGMAVTETVIDRIARKLGKDAAEIRQINFYDKSTGIITHYGQKLTDIRLNLLFDKLIKKADYTLLRKQVEDFNNQNHYYKKGLALTPVKFGISFTTSFLNQAGALVHIYKDGTVQVNHGGTEMGQGLHTKLLDIAAHELGLDHDKIIITATNTSKVPNTSATAASSGSDLNGMAVKNAIDKLKNRLLPVAVKLISKKFKTEITNQNIAFSGNQVFNSLNPDQAIAFKELIMSAYLSQVSLSATGYYKTPGIYFDKEKGKGEPFHYFAYGMAISEVLLDTLSGNHKITKTYIVHDVGSSINHRMDIGQIEGGFIQGVGWCTTEQVKWDSAGKQLTHSPDTYKIPGVRDIPEVFNVEILENAPNPNTIHNSKAVGEPPFMLAFSVWLAIKDAISAVGNHKYEPDFALPATNDEILLSIEKIKKQLEA
jgi:xanthine dehydrogenase molybdopterin binding subunit